LLSDQIEASGTERSRRGVFRGGAEPADAIRDDLNRHNADPMPFVRANTAGTKRAANAGWRAMDDH